MRGTAPCARSVRSEKQYSVLNNGMVEAGQYLGMSRRNKLPSNPTHQVWVNNV